MPALHPAARHAILAWYDANGRDLPFRRTTDPYAILVSEAMAQQTQAARAGAAWRGFLAAFPTVSGLAAATPADVLRAWRGLGYNRRALNLWRAARAIVERHDGVVPADVAALDALPGVGPYTARAVAAIAFGGATATASQLQALADKAVSLDRPGAWTHAVMDLGASHCRAASPACESCPARPWCRFAATEPAARRPARSTARKKAPPFPTTLRWLRGRIVDRLRTGSDGEWLAVESPIGDHDEIAVAAALTSLASESLVEVRPPASAGGAWHARLPGH